MRGPQTGHPDCARFRVRIRAEQDAIDHTKEGRSGSNAKGQREHGYRREARMLKKLAQGESQVVHAIVDFKCAIPHLTLMGDKRFAARISSKIAVDMSVCSPAFATSQITKLKL